MQIDFVKTQENGDATCNYDVKTCYPVSFKDFLLALVERDKREFRITIHATNDGIGHWMDAAMELYRDSDDDHWYLDYGIHWYVRMKNFLVESCWANGGYGQMAYTVTFAKDRFGNFIEFQHKQEEKKEEVKREAIPFSKIEEFYED